MSSPQVLDIAWRQIRGARSHQQDSATTISIDGAQHLLVLADGMGGHPSGDLASDIVVKNFCHAWHDPEAPNDIPDRLIFALQAANLALYKRVIAQPELSGMGTTLVAAHVEDSHLHWISVGDSPLWLFENGALARLNANHSVAALLDQQAADGKISVEEARRSPERSQLLEAVNGDDIHLVDVSSNPSQLPSDSVLILASDGVETCSIGELAALIESRNDRSAKDLAGKLLNAVETHQRPGQDNATLIVLRTPEALESRCQARPTSPSEATTVPLHEGSKHGPSPNKLPQPDPRATA